MTTISTDILRKTMPDVLGQVRFTGKSFGLTVRGRLVAKLVPPDEADTIDAPTPSAANVRPALINTTPMPSL